MQTLLDWSKIIQLHRFIKYSKANYLDLQFIFPRDGKKTSDLQKIIIFVNGMTEIWLMIKIIEAWIIKLRYPPSLLDWIRLYYLMIFELDKAKTAEVYCVLANENIECMIFVTTDTYNIDINNPNIKLVI